MKNPLRDPPKVLTPPPVSTFAEKEVGEENSYHNDKQDGAFHQFISKKIAPAPSFFLGITHHFGPGNHGDWKRAKKNIL